MDDQTITFNGPRDFTNFLNGQEELVKNIPALSSIIKNTNLMDVGCKCKQKQKIITANETYANVVAQYLSEDDKAKIKETLPSAKQIIFKLEESIVTTI